MSQMNCSIEKIGNRAVLRCQGLGMALLWQAADDFYHAVKRLAKFSQDYSQHKDHARVVSEHEVIDKQLTIHRTGLEFTFEISGRIWFQCPWEIAVQISKAIYAKAREIEEEEKHAQVIEDAAILLRSGLQIGITDNRKIRKEAWKAAEDIKFPGCIEPGEFVGKPTITQSPPAVEQPVLQRN